MTASSRIVALSILAVGVIASAAIVFAGTTLPVSAQEDTIVFPVAELGGCESKEACKAYCADVEHIEACVSFAEAHGLMKKEEAEIAKKFAHTLQEGGGPGGCTDQDSCRTFCEDITHIEECIAFADAHGHADMQVEEGRKIAAYIKKGGSMPGGCTSQKSCEAYCNNFDHADECFAFAEDADLEIVEPDGRKMDREQMKKVHALMKSGEMPGGCKSREECDAFCRNPDNGEQCLAFAERAGMMPKEEIERARKMMTQGGPGGCRGREQCEAFCSDPANQEACMQFAVEQGMMPPEDMERMKAMRQQFEHGPAEGARGGGPEMGLCIRDKMMALAQGGEHPDPAAAQAVIEECRSAFGGEFGHRDSEMGPPDGRPGMMPPESFRPAGEALMRERMMQRGDGLGGEGMQGEEFERQFKEQYRHEFNEQLDSEVKNRMQGMDPEQVKRFMESAGREGGMMQEGMKFIQQMRPGMEKGMMPGPDGQRPPFEGRPDGQQGPFGGPGDHPPMMQGVPGTQFQGMPPPEGFHPPDGATQGMPPPPVNGTQGAPPPPQGGEQPPPPPPQTMNPMTNMVASVLTALFALYGAH